MTAQGIAICNRFSGRAWGKPAARRWTQKLCRVFRFALLQIVACIGFANRASAQLVQTIPVHEREYISNLIRDGTQPLDIRVGAIHDRMLVDAIAHGSRTRPIKLLIEAASTDIDDLLDLDNVDVRTLKASTMPHTVGGQPRTSDVYVLRGGRGYVRWSGPWVWERKAFGSKTTVVASSGAEPWETEQPDFDFGRDFSHAVTLRAPRRSRSRIVTAAVVLIAIPAIGAWILWGRKRN